MKTEKGREPEWELIRTQRRSIAIQVKNGRVIVRAPLSTPLDEIRSVVDRHAKWIHRRLACEPAPLSEEELQRLTEKAKQILPARVAFYEKQMGLHPSYVGINRARTRFGSCSSRGRIHFSCRLLQYPPEAVDYVVVHELAHLRYMNHGPEFYRLIERYLPDYQTRRRLLKQLPEREIQEGTICM